MNHQTTFSMTLVLVASLLGCRGADAPVSMESSHSDEEGSAGRSSIGSNSAAPTTTSAVPSDQAPMEAPEAEAVNGWEAQAPAAAPDPMAQVGAGRAGARLAGMASVMGGSGAADFDDGLVAERAPPVIRRRRRSPRRETRSAMRRRTSRAQQASAPRRIVRLDGRANTGRNRPSGDAFGGPGMQNTPNQGLGMAAPQPPPQAAPPLQRSGVIASNFVGGAGVRARLGDLLDRGVMVDGQNVRLSAFQERARLTYPVPADKAVAVYSELERSRLDASGDEVHLQIALIARQGERPRRPRMDVRLVLDRSGSMIGEKWEQAITSAKALVDRLEPTDTFGLISYSDFATLDVPPQNVRDKRGIKAELDRLAPGGGTNIGAALDMAAEHSPERRDATDVTLNILVSDGQATVGQTSAYALGNAARTLFNDKGVLTTAVGLGTDFDEQTMLTVAREGSGSYHFVRRAADINDILRDELEDRALAVAQGLRLRIVLSEGVEPLHIYGSRMLSESEHQAVRQTEVAVDTRLAAELGIVRDRQQEADQGLRLHIPTFKRGDQHVVLLKLRVPRGAADSTAGVARVHLDYKDLAARENKTSEVVVTAERTTAERARASVQRPVKRTVLSFLAGEALQRAANALGTNDMQGALAALAERREVLSAAGDVWRDTALTEDAALISRYERVLQGAWQGWGTDDRRTLMLAMNYFGDQRMR